MEKTVLYLHGFSSSSTAAKARYLSDRLDGMSGTRFLAPDFNPERTDFEYLTVTGMIDRLRQFAIDHNVHEPLIVASSLGCLVALHYTKRFGWGRATPFPRPGALLRRTFISKGSALPMEGKRDDTGLPLQIHRRASLAIRLLP